MGGSVMRNLYLSLLVLGAVAVPGAARAEPTRGIHNGNIVFTYTGEVLPGQEEAFKQLVPKIVAAVEQEPGTLAYEWNMRADGKTFDVVEIYQNSEAVVAHVKDVVAKFGGDLGKTQKTVKLVVYGSPDAEATKSIAGLQPDYETPMVGFMR
jgi:quinol monooxygenase YgiN